ncbi:hypothetical protein DXG01_001859 [Tephrocybe rancida]|nr:hypothetical protein DXG01_001859 [Tephrocybe rancida]
MKISDMQVSEFTAPRAWRLVCMTDTEGEEEECILRFQGALTKKQLPPVKATKLSQFSMCQICQMRQAVTLTGLNTGSSKSGVENIRKIWVLFAGQLPNNKLDIWEPSSLADMEAVDLHARYFMDRHNAPHEDSVPFGLLTDPEGVLEGITTADEFFHGQTIMSNIDRCPSPKEPRCQFRVGDIIEVQTSFIINETDDNFQTAMESRIGAVAEQGFKRQAKTKTLKRKIAYMSKDEDIENTRTSLGNLHLQDVDVNMN